jgi:Zn finger protein HypA/HybF involved in hydrogenase expression
MAQAAGVWYHVAGYLESCARRGAGKRRERRRLKMEDEKLMWCKDCGWVGYPSQLVSAADVPDGDERIYCPDCGSDNVEDWE